MMHRSSIVSGPLDPPDHSRTPRPSATPGPALPPDLSAASPLTRIAAPPLRSDHPLDGTGPAGLRQRIPGTLLLRALLLLLLGLLFLKGILPAFTTIDTDFPNYYTAGRIILEGGPAGRLYDDAWFQQRIREEGIDRIGKFSPFPPATALISAPLGFFSPMTSMRMLTVLSLLALAGSLFLLVRTFRLPFEYAALVLLLSGTGLANCLRFGQLYVLLSSTLILGYYFFRTGRPVLAGICFGFWIPVKYYPAVFLLFFALQKETRLVLSALGTAFLLSAVSLLVMGWEVHRRFILDVAGSHLAGHLSLQSPYSPAFQSFGSLFRRLFEFDAQLNPRPLLVSPALLDLLLIFTPALLTGLALYTLVRSRSADRAGMDGLPVLAIGTLLASPATATYHFVLLWLPAGLMLADATGRMLAGVKSRPFRRLDLALAGCYAALGFIPYAFFGSLAEQLHVAPLAYPRLIVLSVLFALVLVRVFLRTPHGRQTAGVALPAGTLRQAGAGGDE